MQIVLRTADSTQLEVANSAQLEKTKLNCLKDFTEEHTEKLCERSLRTRRDEKIMLETACVFRYLLTILVVVVLLNIVCNGIISHGQDSGLDTSVKHNLVFHSLKRRSASKSIGNLRIERKGPSSLTVKHKGRTLHYNGRGVVNGMLQEYFGVQPRSASSTALNDPQSLISNPNQAVSSSSSYTSGRERYSLANPRPEQSKQPNVVHSSSSSSNSRYVSRQDSKSSLSGQVIDSSREPGRRSGRPYALQERQRARTNYWSNMGDRTPARPVLSRKPSYVEYFRMRDRKSDKAGQTFSGYAFRIKQEDRLLFPQYGEEHLRAVTGLSMYPSTVSDYYGPRKTLELVSEAVINGMYAQYFGVKQQQAPQ